MELSTLLGILQESLFMILVFFGFFLLGIVRGRQFLINLMLALYFALLISIKFPYYGYFIDGSDASASAGIMILIFATFTVFSLLLFNRLMPVDFEETAFQGLGKKIVVAALGTILIMGFSYHALPVTEFITPGSPIQSLFAPESNFFWWLLIPLIGLFFL